jgi:hypothetical protein
MPRTEAIIAAIVFVLICATTPRHALAGRSAQQYASISSLRQVAGSGGKAVEIALTSDTPFVTDSNQQFKLIIASQHFTDYHFRHGSKNTIVFTIDRRSFDSIPDGSDVEVGFGNQRGIRWHAGPLNKSLLGNY